MKYVEQLTNYSSHISRGVNQERKSYQNFAKRGAWKWNILVASFCWRICSGVSIWGHKKTSYV